MISIYNVNRKYLGQIDEFVINKPNTLKENKNETVNRNVYVNIPTKEIKKIKK